MVKFWDVLEFDNFAWILDDKPLAWHADIWIEFGFQLFATMHTLWPEDMLLTNLKVLWMYQGFLRKCLLVLSGHYIHCAIHLTFRLHGCIRMGQSFFHWNCFSFLFCTLNHLRCIYLNGLVLDSNSQPFQNYRVFQCK